MAPLCFRGGNFFEKNDTIFVGLSRKIIVEKIFCKYCQKCNKVLYKTNFRIVIYFIYITLKVHFKISNF